ncbi:multidrug effflux MFS transporter [Snodgrassella sp. CFCC 13594]|uniref:multidrug effflux MFS transporter n=1 Tax=Snodgrassella sp. CFCC 13594 TaxID=1775559 RepID=UPI000833794B|nr:multidrug effflux MFS transporter [Snodgrassella sp. CFCC 13594]
MTVPVSLPLGARKLAFLLAAMVAIMPFSIDVYLPAVPVMAQSLHADIHIIEQTLSSFIFGVAIGQLLGGAISDVKGRKHIALLGLAIYLVAVVAILFIQSASELLFWRWVQAIGGGMSTVTVGAVVRDFFSGREAAKMFTTIGIITMAAPLAAPMVGAALTHIGGWRAIFVFLTVYTVVVWLLVSRFMPTTRVTRKPLNWQLFGTVGRNFATVFRQPEALGFLFFQAFSFSSMFVFLTESPFVYMKLYGLDAHQYAWAFGANILTMMAFNRITAFRLRTTDAKDILLSGIAVQLVCNTLLAVAVWAMPLPPFALVLLLLMCSVGTQGLVMSNTQACFMGYFSQAGGSANAVLGTMQFLIAAAVGWLTTQLHNGTAHIMPSMMLVSTLCGVVLLALCSHRAWRR